MNKKVILFALLLFGIQYVSGQDALSSVNINICNVQLSSNAKTLSYDVYLRSTNKDTVVAVPGFVFRLAIPQADLGTNEKRIFLTNTTKELGSCAEAITYLAPNSTAGQPRSNFSGLGAYNIDAVNETQNKLVKK